MRYFITLGGSRLAKLISTVQKLLTTSTFAATIHVTDKYPSCVFKRPNNPFNKLNPNF